MKRESPPFRDGECQAPDNRIGGNGREVWGEGAGSRPEEVGLCGERVVRTRPLRTMIETRGA